MAAPNPGKLIDRILSFHSGTFDGWTQSGEAWTIRWNPALFANATDMPRYVVDSLAKGEAKTGTLRSSVFEIKKARQSFSIAGWDGETTGTNDAQCNFVRLRSHPDGRVLQQAHTPGGDKFVPVQWSTAGLIGRRVYLEVVDGNPRKNPGGFAWIAMADYRQENPPNLKEPVQCTNLYAVKIDQASETITCRTVPFLAAHPAARGESKRTIDGAQETIAIGAEAQALYLLGMINQDWDMGVAHWCEHPEYRKERDDQIYIGKEIGVLELCYQDGSSDRIPLVFGATAWFANLWTGAPTNLGVSLFREPFASRPDLAAKLTRSLKLYEGEPAQTYDRHFAAYYLAIKPAAKRIDRIVMHDNPALRGRPMLSAITLAAAGHPAGLVPFGSVLVDGADLKPRVDATRQPQGGPELAELAKALYTREQDLPRQVELLASPKDWDATSIRFLGKQPECAMLSNIWTANLRQIDEKFTNDGFFHETGKTSPNYGGYSGFGTWLPLGGYYASAYSRSADHFATVAMRCIRNPERNTHFVDFCDQWLYYYRPNHDPKLGPANKELAVERYPKDAPPHWTMNTNGPSIPYEINEIPGDEEMDGHGAMIVARWVAWRTLGMPKGEWLTAPRKNVYGKSRWDATRDATEFICWLMDYTGRDVIWSEGESTGWACGAPPDSLSTPKGMATETDPVKIRANYANANMYEVYPSYACLTALRCAAQMSEAMGDAVHAKKWLAYADRIQAGMLRQFKVGDHNNFVWRSSPYTVFPTQQQSLAVAWLSIYKAGLDPALWDPSLALITRNTFKMQVRAPHGYAPVLGMGYGLGWLTHSALALDEMDDAAPLLANIARYSYDKNMDYADAKRGIDWRPWLWIVPEGTNILPDGSWHRIGDLSNGANQGPCLHALEACAGVDDCDPQDLKIMPRVPAPLTGIDVENFFTLIPDGEGYKNARVNYHYETDRSFHLSSDEPLPSLAVRLGPFAGGEAAQQAMKSAQAPQGARLSIQASGRFKGRDAWWLWVKGLRQVKEVTVSLGEK